MKKRLLGMVMVIAMLVTLFPATSWAALHETDVLSDQLKAQFGRNGKFLARIDIAAPTGKAINTADELMQIGNNIDFPASGEYYLADNIDLKSAEWIPLCSEAEPFSGSINGWGYEIRNITITSLASLTPENTASGDTYYAGLFAYVDGATFENLGISTSINISGAEAFAAESDASSISYTSTLYAGGLFACGIGDVVITNCYNMGTTTAPSVVQADTAVDVSNIGAGAQAGYSAYANAYVYTGGLFAYNKGTTTINGSYNHSEAIANATTDALCDTTALTSATAQASSDCYALAGGFFARNDGVVAITNSYNMGKVYAKNDKNYTVAKPTGISGYTSGYNASYAGGMYGLSAQNAEITNGYNCGDITAAYGVRLGSSLHPDANCAGGIFGNANGYVDAGNCYNTGNISGYNAGGIYGYSLSAANVRNACNSGDITGTQNAGGIYGFSNSSAANTRKSYNTGKVTAPYAGGINGHTASSAAVSDCYNTGVIEGSPYAGGILGYNGGDTSGSGSVSVIISECYNIGAVTGGIAGAICGSNNGSLPADIAESCYWNTETSVVSVGVAQGNDTTNGRSTEAMQQQTTFGGFNFFNVWIIDAQENDGYPYLRASTTITGIFYPPSEEDIIVYGWVNGVPLESRAPAEINLEVEQLILYTEFDIKSYSKDGGRTWKTARKARSTDSLPKVFNAAKFPRMLDKGLSLQISDAPIDKKTKKPTSDGTIIMFQAINKRPAIPRTNLSFGNKFIALTPNYELGADATGITTGVWMLGGVSEKQKDALYVTPADTNKLQIGVSDVLGKKVDSMGYGRFYIDPLTQRPKGITVEQYANKIMKTAYFVRIAPTYIEGEFTAASKPKKIIARSTLKAPSYRLKKDGYLSIKPNTYVQIGDNPPVLYKERTSVYLGFYDTAEIWTAATSRKTASEKQIILPMMNRDTSSPPPAPTPVPTPAP